MEVEFIWKEHFDDKMCNGRIKGNEHNRRPIEHKLRILLLLLVSTHRNRLSGNKRHQLVNFLGNM